MNYRHAFHAGNFADLIKHAVLTHLLRALVRGPASLTVIDTHAGAGLYDLAGEAARRTGEGMAGVARLIAAGDITAAFADLQAAIGRANTSGELRWYPGSPVLIGEALRPRDRLIACELRADDHARLKGVLPRHLGAEVLRADGWDIASGRAPSAPAPLLVLIDPPYERSDDPVKLTLSMGAILRRNPGAVIALWTPIKDLTSFDTLLGAVEDAAAGAPLLIVEVRLRPLGDPMTLNGCAMLVVNPPPQVIGPAGEAAEWIARLFGEEGAVGRITARGFSL